MGLVSLPLSPEQQAALEPMRVLALRGVHVVMGVRNLSAGKEVQGAIRKQIPDAKVDAMELDLSSMASVTNFASQFKRLGLPLNLLINNAGIMATPFILSKDNIELQFATNHIGHFLLTNLLLETMKSTVQKTGKEGRVVNVSSRRHRFSYPEGIRFEKINDKSGYNCLSAYGQSKLANILHANELARRLKEEGVEITANSLHPGAISTDLFRHHPVFMGIINAIGKQVMKSVQQGAATTCYAALHPSVRGVSGAYFADNNVAEPSSQGSDTEMAKKLWDLCSTLTHSPVTKISLED